MAVTTKPKKTIGNVIKALAALFLIAAAIFVFWMSRSPQPKINGTNEFFSDDDGKTWFADDGTKVAPFDHNGKQAVLVKVFQAKDGKPFVGYMMKFTDEARDQMLHPPAAHQPRAGPSLAPAASSNGLLVKRPNDQAWISESDPRAQQIMTIGDADQVNP